MTPIILLALLSSPLFQPKIPTDNKMQFFKDQWLLCINQLETSCPYQLPKRIIDTEKWWHQEWDRCVEAQVKCELEKANG